MRSKLRVLGAEPLSRVEQAGKEVTGHSPPSLSPPPPGDRKKTRAPQQALRPRPAPTSSPGQLSEMPCSEWAGPRLQGPGFHQNLLQGEGPGVPEPWAPASGEEPEGQPVVSRGCRHPGGWGGLPEGAAGGDGHRWQQQEAASSMGSASRGLQGIGVPPLPGLAASLLEPTQVPGLGGMGPSLPGPPVHTHSPCAACSCQW